MSRRAALAGVLAVVLCLAALCPARGLHAAQYSSEGVLHVGDLLVASEKLSDPNFAESVVVILQREEDGGTAGVIINRRSEIPISRVFPEIKGAGSDPVFVGGPVSITAVQALLRLREEADNATHIAGDVYAAGSKQVIEKCVREHLAPSKFRLYAGYAGWGAGQLEAEMQLGAWSVLTNRARVIFDDDPDSLWSRLTHESHMQIATRRFALFDGLCRWG